MNQGRVASTSRVGELAAAPGESSVSHAAQRVIVAEGVARAGRRSRLAAAYNEARSRAESEGDDLGLGIEAYAVVAAVREDMTVEEVLCGATVSAAVAVALRHPALRGAPSIAWLISERQSERADAAYGATQSVRPFLDALLVVLLLLDELLEVIAGLIAEED
jgi:hypothetical protein